LRASSRASAIGFEVQEYASAETKALDEHLSEILPWVRVPHLASHILSRATATLSRDWEQIYGHPIWFVETFIDPERFRGTCYRAANWILMGRTTGRGKDDLTHRQNRSIKDSVRFLWVCSSRWIAGKSGSG
jgi:hypothetical protein